MGMDHAAALIEAFETNDIGHISNALSGAARDCGITEAGEPTLDTFLKVTKALDLTIKVKPLAAR